MRLSTASASSPSKQSDSWSGSRARKKHKRLDAICEKEYSRNHGDFNEDSGRAGIVSSLSEPRRSSRVRRPPDVLDVSPKPPKKRRRIDRNMVVSVNNSAKTLTHDYGNSKDIETGNLKGIETSGSWTTRLRSRSRNAGFGKKERSLVSAKRNLFKEVNELKNEQNAMEIDMNDNKGDSEGGKSKVVKSKRPGRIKAINASKEGRKEIKSLENTDEDVNKEVVVMGNEFEEALKGEGNEEGMVVGDKSKEDSLLMKNEIIGENERRVVDNNLPSVVETGEQETPSGVNDNAETEKGMAAIEHETRVEQLQGTKEPETHTEDVEADLLTNEVADGGNCDEKDVDLPKVDGKYVIHGNLVKEDRLVKTSSDTFDMTCIKEGRRCGLCGGGTDGKPPKKLAQEIGESENETFSGSFPSDEPNYDIWDGFGDEPGWLGRLLGPINDRHGIAGIWVHQHCAVWSPEVYFAGLGCLKNVRAALCRGRVLKCTRCGRAGATIGCRVDRCPKTYHLPCARANGCIFDHRKFLIACTDHRHIFQPHGSQYLAQIKKRKAKKMKLELRKLSNDAWRRDIEAEEKWLENCGEDEEFLKRESKRLHRDLIRIAPVYIGGSGSEGGRLFQGWDSVAGLQDVIRCMKEVVILPLLYPEFFDSLGITPPRGVLLHGYPGTGKTLVVRALIGACARGDRRIAYFARKGADCLGKYVGDAERQLRLLFQVAERCQPSIIFFDEIDGLAPSRTRQQDQTHISVVSTLLALLDGLKSRGSVVVIGATNRPEAVDPALRRPGRFDREIYFPLPSGDDRAAILTLHTQRWPKPVGGHLLQWIARRTAGFAGADLQALCTQAAIVALKRNFPLHDILSAAAVKGSCGKRPPLPAFAVEERDWLEALSCAPPPCSRREAGMAANDVVSSPLPPHLVPCLLKALTTLLVSLFLDERLWLPPTLSEAATMIKSLLVSALNEKKMASGRWWSHVNDFIQETDISKEIEITLGSSGILLADTNFASYDHNTESNDEVRKFRPFSAHHDGSHPSLIRHPSFASRKKSGYRILIAGNPRYGQRYLASCILHCFVGNIEVQKIDLATISQEGHGDVVQGITQILMKCASAGPCMLFMPRIDLWAVETYHEVTEESDFCSMDYQSSEKGTSLVNHDQITEEDNVNGSEQCESAEMEVLQGDFESASHAWISFVEGVESLSLSISFMIMATSEISLPLLPQRVRQFFRSDTSICSQSTGLVEHSTPRFSVQIDENFNRDRVINLSAAVLSRDIVQLLVQLIQQRSHVNSTSVEGYRTSDSVEDRSGVLYHSTDNLSANKFQEESTKSPDDTSIIAFPSPLSNSKTIRVKSNVLLAISTFGFQILRYPHFAVLCWVTSKLKEGPSADISGPWKGWPFNSCIIRPASSEKVAVGSSSNVKAKEKSSTVRGLVAVGLSAYRGDYTSLREVSFEVRKVLDLLVGEINAKVKAGKDRYQYVRLLSQVGYMEDMVNCWAYTLQSLEQNSPRIMPNNNPSGLGYLDSHHASDDRQLQINVADKCSQTQQLAEGNLQASTDGKVECAAMTKGDGQIGHFCHSNGGTSMSEVSQQENILGSSAFDKPHQSSASANLLVDNILPEKSGTIPTISAVVDGYSEDAMQHANGVLIGDPNVTFNHLPGISGELVGDELSRSTKVSSKNNESSSTETILSSGKTGVPTHSGIICSFRCCSGCLNILRHLIRKILLHEFGFNKNDWTAEDVHDVVASLSVELLAAVRREFHSANGSSSFDERRENYNCPYLQNCHCRRERKMVALVEECSCHSENNISTAEANDSSYSQPGLDLKFIFRDGVMVNVDSDKDVSYHCKLETLCLCSLIELIVLTKKPFD